jgi:hypothetical protein
MLDSNPHQGSVDPQNCCSINQRWAGPQLVPLCAFPQLAQQGNLLRKCAVIRREMTAELRMRTKK